MRAPMFRLWDLGDLPESHSMETFFPFQLLFSSLGLRELLCKNSPPPSRWGRDKCWEGGAWKREQVKDEKQCSEPRAEGSRS